MLKRTIVFAILLLVCNTLFLKAFAQPMWTLDPFGKEKKPEKYETRKNSPLQGILFKILLPTTIIILIPIIRSMLW